MKRSLRGLVLAFSLFACHEAVGQVTTINSLPPATTPLTGAEKIPIWQNGATKAVTVANLPSGGGGGTPCTSTANAIQYNNSGVFDCLGVGTALQVLHGNAAGAATFSAVSLTADVTGILPGANGGTNNAFMAFSGPASSLKTFTLPNSSATILTSAAAVTVAQGGTNCTSAALSCLTAITGATGTPSGTTFLRGDNTWATPSGSGNVSGPGSAVSGNVASFNGTSGTIIQDGGIATSAIATLTGSQTLTNKTLTAPVINNLGTTTTIAHGNAAGAISFSAVSLTADVSGILPGANGGTGNGFFAVTGPTTSLKTFTLPNASATILTSNAAVTVAQGGTGCTTAAIACVTAISGATGTPSSTTFLRGDNTWSTPAGSGTVTSIGLGSGLCSSGSNPITTSGTITPCATVSARTTTTEAITSADGGKIVSASNASAQAYSIPQATGAGLTLGFGFDLHNIGAGAVTLTSTTSVFDNGLTTLALTKGQDAFVWSDSTNYHSVVSLPVMAADTVLGNFSATANYPTAAALTSCSTASSALTYNTSTHAWGCNSISGGGGGTFNYSSGNQTLSASTYFAPIGGGGIPVTTEAAVQVNSPAATTIANLKVTLSVDPGNANTVVVTARKAGSDQTLTCTVTGNGTTNKTCSDTTHSFNVVAGDLLDWKIVNSASFTGTVNLSASNGTSNVGVTSVTCGTGLTGGAITTTGTCAVDYSTTNVWTGMNSSTPVAITISTATFTPSGAKNHYTVGLTSGCPCTLANFSATPVAGTDGTFVIQQDGTGSRTITTWGSTYYIEGGTSAITLSTAANAIDVFAYHVIDSTHVVLTFAAKGISH